MLHPQLKINMYCQATFLSENIAERYIWSGIGALTGIVAVTSHSKLSCTMQSGKASFVPKKKKKKKKLSCTLISVRHILGISHEYHLVINGYKVVITRVWSGQQ
jgi:hypothetical protein